MKKLIVLFSVFLLTITTVLADDMRFIQVTDTFFTQKNEKTVYVLKKLIKNINTTKNVDFVVFSGNNIANPNPKDLEVFLEITKDLKIPYYLILGNKDVNKSKDLSKKEYLRIVSKNNKSHKKIATPNYSFIKNDIVFIIVDGSKDVIPTSAGYYKTDTLKWLDSELEKYSDKKVVILQHFPIIPPTNNELKFTSKPEEYLALLNKHKNIKAIFSGHFGVNTEKEINGIIHITTANAPQYRVVDILDYETENPTFWSTIKQ